MSVLLVASGHRTRLFLPPGVMWLHKKRQQSAVFRRVVFDCQGQGISMIRIRTAFSINPSPYLSQNLAFTK